MPYWLRSMLIVDEDERVSGSFSETKQGVSRLPGLFPEPFELGGLVHLVRHHVDVQCALGRHEHVGGNVAKHHGYPGIRIPNIEHTNITRSGYAPPLVTFEPSDVMQDLRALSEEHVASSSVATDFRINPRPEASVSQLGDALKLVHIHQLRT